MTVASDGDRRHLRSTENKLIERLTRKIKELSRSLWPAILGVSLSISQLACATLTARKGFEDPMAVAAKKAGRASQGAANKQAQQKSVAKKITPNVPQFDKNQDLAYRETLLIRRFEEKRARYGMGLIGGFCHLYIGQEAVVVGMQMTTRGRPAGSRVTAITATCSPAA